MKTRDRVTRACMVLAVVISVGALINCGGGEDSASPATTASTTVTTAATVPESQQQCPNAASS